MERVLQNIDILEDDHLYPSHKKIEWFDDGQWVEEGDYKLFSYLGYTCKVVRVGVSEPFIFGGYFCGYISVPADHPFYNTPYMDIDIDCHGGLTYGEFEEDKGYWIGFDCAHSTDYVPGIEKNKKKCPHVQQWRAELSDKFPQFRDSPLFNKMYRNMDFCVSECVKIVDQLRKMKKEDA